MALSAEVLSFILYISQQFGMMMGFGSEIILLFAFIAGRRDGVITEEEDHLAHTVYRVMIISLILIIFSGIGITATHLSANGGAVVFAASFVFKWILIGIATTTALMMKGSHLWNKHIEGLAGANWGALFLIHIFAPLTSIGFLLEFYATWVAAFMVAWYLILFASHVHTKHKNKNKGEPDLSNLPPAPHYEPKTSSIYSPLAPSHNVQPITPEPILQTKHVETPLVAPLPIVERGPIAPIHQPYNPEILPGLPTIRVMPQTHEELKKSIEQSNIQPA